MPTGTKAAAPATSLARRFGLDLPPRQRVCAAFFLYAFGLGGIFPRLGDIQRGLGVAEGALGFALTGAAFGTMLTLTFAGPWVERLGTRRVLLGALACLPCGYALASHATSPAMLFALLIPIGLFIGAIEIVVNLEADRVEQLSGRRLMNRAHGFWSVGFFGAGLFGAGLSHLGVSPQAHLWLVVPAVWAGTLLLLGRFEPAPARSGVSHTAPSPFTHPTWGVMLLVVLTFSATLLEGAGIDWSAIYMRDVFGAGPFTAGFAVAIGAFFQGATRFAADGLVERHSPVIVARAFLAVLGAGALLVFEAPSGGVALLGFALMGVGTSAIFPLAMSAAAQRTDRPAATNVAALAQFSFVAFLLGPPLLGFVAERWGVRWAYGAGLPLVALSLAASGALRVRS